MNHLLKTVTVLAFIIVSQSIFGQLRPIDKETARKIDSLFNKYHQEDKRGSIVSIIKSEQVVYCNKKGLANIEHRLPINNTTVFNIASNSKQFTMFLALLLEEEGKLSLEDDIRSHLPELKHLPNKITIKQLANHTHGLPNTDELSLLIGANSLNHDQAVEMLLNIKQVSFRAGEEHYYNNTGFMLLSVIIERVGKKPFEEQLEERIFAPLKMNNTRVIKNSSTVVYNKAYSYSLQDSVYRINASNFSTMGSSGIYTTMEDLNLWVKNYQNTTIGKKEFYEKMEILTTLNSGKQTNYGLGLQHDTFKGIDVVFHGGGKESYRSYILHAPKHQLSLVFLSNKDDMVGLDIMYGALEIILKDHIQNDSKFEVLKGEKLKQLQGTYQVFPGNYYNFIVENDKLYFQFFGTTEKYHFPQIGENTFEYPVAHYKISFDEDGMVLHQADMDYFCPKTDVKLESAKDLNLNKFIGTYKNEVYNTSYEIVIKNGVLMASHFNKDFDIKLYPLTKNTFTSYEGYFGKIDFIPNSNGIIESFNVSGQNLKNIPFTKM